jgi:hypothetical protein
MAHETDDSCLNDFTGYQGQFYFIKENLIFFHSYKSCGTYQHQSDGCKLRMIAMPLSYDIATSAQD